MTSWTRVKSCAAVQTLPECQFQSVNFSLYAICTLGLREKCLKLGVGRRIRATFRLFCRGTSILAHLGNSGYTQGRHKQPQITHTHTRSVRVSVCWHSSEKITLVEPSKNTSRVTPLFSRLPSCQTASARASISHLFAPIGPE